MCLGDTYHQRGDAPNCQSAASKRYANASLDFCGERESTDVVVSKSAIMSNLTNAVGYDMIGLMCPIRLPRKHLAAVESFCGLLGVQSLTTDFPVRKV